MLPKHPYDEELLQIAAEQALNTEQYQRLQQLSLTQSQADKIINETIWFNRAIFMLGGLFLGLSAIFWVAANWDNFSNFHRFALAETILITSLIAGCFDNRLRSAALLIAVLALGALLALYAQVYSSSADPWRLFAIWAAIALPIALAARHQAVWLCWWGVVLIATSLWYAEQFETANLSGSHLFTLVAWGSLLLLNALLFPKGLLHNWLGNYSQHAFRWAGISTLIFIAFTGFAIFYFHDQLWVSTLFYSLSLAIIAAVIVLLYKLRYLDMPLFACSLFLADFLVVSGWFRLFIDIGAREGGWLIITFVAVGISILLLALSIKLLRRLGGELKHFSSSQYDLQGAEQ